ncbi:MAG: hypothetical protein EPO39_11920 [Candidatus Manganitrophaceae bacterium]|nr:MAG: hypothetical protein EPO39_11920 [Candidatus Manganitrophaceae bacterium]
MLQAILKKNRHSLSLFTAALVVYLLLFSGFALFHAYSEDELVDPHGCAIGLWVQNSQASVPFLAALALFLIHLTGNPLPRLFLPVKQISRQRATRAPPYHASLC